MKSIIIGAVLCAAAFPALAQSNVSISVGQPGFFGQVNIGDFAPQPVLYAPQPVIVRPMPEYAAEPIYLRVPPGHRQHWARFCGRYNACGRPVLFVRDEWYTNTYVPRYHEHFHGGYRPEMTRVVERVEYRDHDRGHERGYDGGWDRGHERDHGDREDHGRGHGEGHGEGRGEGHGEGHGHGHGHD
jgi:hypothetical protein